MSAIIISREYLLSTEFLLNFLKTITEEQKEIIAKRSYYHTNHFFKVVLSVDYPKPGWKIRVHYWLKQPSFEQNPHSHGWDFTSRIIQGSLLDVQYEEETTTKKVANIYKKFDMMLTTKDPRYYCKATEEKTTALSVNKIRAYSPGDIYHSHHKIVHTSHPVDDKVITVVLEEPQASESNLIYVKKDTLFEETNSHRQVTMKELNWILKSMKSALKSSQQTRISKL